MKNFDNQFLKNHINLIAGVDEAGRGPLAGPVVAASVIFDKTTNILSINDSKKLSEKKREILFTEIKEKALCYGIGIIENDEIDKINILQATLKAMKKAVSQLSLLPDLILIDGNQSFKTELPIRTIIKGDGKSMAIAAASILAKVTRDNIMKNLSVEFPQYSWERNKGYPTKAHREMIIKHGITKYHRKSFLSKILSGEK